MSLPPLPPYAELHCLSNFTFLRGASHPHELVHQAIALGYSALALTDECSVAGVVRAHMAAKERPLKLIVGAEFRLECGLKFVALALNRAGYAQLCRLITRGRRQAQKGQYRLSRADFEALPLPECFILWLPDAQVRAERRQCRETLAVSPVAQQLDRDAQVRRKARREPLELGGSRSGGGRQPQHEAAREVYGREIGTGE